MDKRFFILKVAGIIASTGKDGISISEIMNELADTHEISTSDNYLREIVRSELKNCLGNITVGSRRWTKYIIDSYEVAIEMINSYYLSIYTEAERWGLYNQIADYIRLNDLKVTDLKSYFLISDNEIDRMNSELAEYAGELEFTKNKVKLGRNTLGVIRGKLRELTVESPKPEASPEVDTPKGDDELDVNISFSIIECLITHSLSEKDIHEMLKEVTIPRLSIELAKLRKLSYIGFDNSNRWYLKDQDALKKIAPELATIKLAVAVRDTAVLDGLTIDSLLNLNGYKMCTITCDNSINTVFKLYDLITSNQAEFDQSVREYIIKLVKDMAIKERKFLIRLPTK